MGVEDVKQRLRDRATQTVRLAAVEIRRQMRADTNKDTGRTSRGWYVTEPTVVGSSVRIELRHPQSPQTPPDVLWLDQGTRPHVITARRARVLAFRGRSGEMVFRRQVFHPGYAGSHFIAPVLARWPTLLQQAWRTVPR